MDKGDLGLRRGEADHSGEMTEGELIVWAAVAEWLGGCGFWFERDEGIHFQARLFGASTVPAWLSSSRCLWLPHPGLRPPEPSPLVAYRLQLIHARMLRPPRPAMEELIGLAGAVPEAACPPAAPLASQRAAEINAPRQSDAVPPRRSSGSSEFERWLHEQLRRVCPLGKGEEAVHEILLRLLKSNCPGLGAEDVSKVEQTLFNLQPAADTSRMVGFVVPDTVRSELLALGFTVQEVARFPALAYRIKMLRKRLGVQPASVEELLNIARSFPLADAERAAAVYARQRESAWLRRRIEQSGYRWTLDLARLNHMLPSAIENRDGVRDTARLLGNALRREHVYLDTLRLMRTEMSRALCYGHWQVDSLPWGPDTLIFRYPSTFACRWCLELYTSEKGMPRLYRVEQVAVRGCMRPNTGPRRHWSPKVGPTHDQCTCPPWSEWSPYLASIFEDETPVRLELPRNARR